MNQLTAIHLLNSSLGPSISIPCRGQIGLSQDPGIGTTYVPHLLNLFWTGEWPDRRNSPKLEQVFLPYQNSWILFEADGSTGPFVLVVYAEKGQLKRQLLAGDWLVADWLDNEQAMTPETWYKRLKKKKISFPPLIQEGAHLQRVFRGELLAKERKAYQSFGLFPEKLPHFPADIYSSSIDLTGMLVKIARLQEVCLDLKSLRNLLHSFVQRKQELELVGQVQPAFEALHQLHNHHLSSKEELQALFLELVRKHPIQLKEQQQIRKKLKAAKSQLTEVAVAMASLSKEKAQQKHSEEDNDLKALLSQKMAVNSLELQLASIPKEIPAREIRAFQLRQQAVFREGQIAEMQLRMLAFHSKSLEGQERRERKELEKGIEVEEQQLLLEIGNLELQIQELEDQQAQLKGTFLSWLEARYPGWEQSIGKIAREEILLHPYLAPQIERLNDLFYGIQLDLTEVEVDLPNEHQLTTQLEALKETLDREQQRLAEFRESSVQKQERFEKRFQQKHRNLQKEFRQAQYAVEQSELQLKKWQAQEAAHVQQWTIQQEKRRLELEAKLSKLQDRPSKSANHSSEEYLRLKQESENLNDKIESYETELKQIQETLGTWKKYQASVVSEGIQEEASIEALPESFSTLLKRYTRKTSQLTQSLKQVEKAWQAFSSHFPGDALWGIPAKWESQPLSERLDQWVDVYESDQLQQWQRRLMEEHHQLWGQIREVVKPYLDIPTRLQAVGELFREAFRSLQVESSYLCEWEISPHPLVQLLGDILQHGDQLGDSSGRSLFQPVESQDPSNGFPLLAQLSELLGHWSVDSLDPSAAISIQQTWKTAWGEEVPLLTSEMQKRANELAQLAMLLLWKQTSDEAHQDWKLTFCSTAPLSERVWERTRNSGINCLQISDGPLPKGMFSQELSWELEEGGLKLIAIS